MAKLRICIGETTKMSTPDLIECHNRAHNIAYQREHGCMNPRFDHDASVHELVQRGVTHITPFKCGVLEPSTPLTRSQRARRKGKVTPRFLAHKKHKPKLKRGPIGELKRNEMRLKRRLDWYRRRRR